MTLAHHHLLLTTHVLKLDALTELAGIGLTRTMTSNMTATTYHDVMTKGRNKNPEVGL